MKIIDHKCKNCNLIKDEIYTMTCLVSDNICIGCAVDLFYNDRLFYNTHNIINLILEVHKESTDSSIKELYKLVTYQENLVSCILNVYYKAVENEEKINYDIKNKCEKDFINFILNLFLIYDCDIYSEVYGMAILAFLIISKITITENQFYKLHFLKNLNVDYRYVSYNFIKNNFSYMSKYDEFRRLFKIKVINHDSDEYDIYELDNSFKIDIGMVIKLPKVITNVSLVIKHIIYHDSKYLFDLIKNNIILENDNIIYEIINSSLIEYDLSAYVICYILYSYKFKLNLEKIQIINGALNLSNFREQLEDNIKNPFSTPNKKVALKKQFLTESLRIYQKIFNNIKLNSKQVCNLYMNSVLFNFSKLNFTNDEINQIYFEYFSIYCNMSIYNTIKIAKIFMNFTDNKQIILRELCKTSNIIVVNNFVNLHNVKPDRYCIVNAIICKNNILQKIKCYDGYSFNICGYNITFSQKIFGESEKKSFLKSIKKLICKNNRNNIDILRNYMEELSTTNI